MFHLGGGADEEEFVELRHLLGDADDAGRAELDALWSSPDVERLGAARELVRRWGGVTSTQRLIDARTRSATRAVEALGDAPAALMLGQLLAGLARRTS